MTTILNRTTLSTGIAIFSMFFGAGNVVFPLLLGQISGDMISYALIGLLITAIGGPMLGMLGAILFQGKSKLFFARIGKPGYLMMLCALALLGPFAVMPRCVTVAYAGFQPLFPSVNLTLFTLMFIAVSLICCLNRQRVIVILGYVLSPLLLACLIMIIIKGKTMGHAYPVSSLSPKDAFFGGLTCGYDTMDLIASLFFSATIWNLLKGETDPSSLFKMTIVSGCIGGLLLGLVYIGLSDIAALHTSSMKDIPPEQLITTLSHLTLGPLYGSIANLAILLACLTTVISLTTTISDFFAEEIPLAKANYSLVLTAILIITGLFASLGFERLMYIIHPMVVLCYPAIIVLTICNIFYKTHDFVHVRIPVAVTFLVTLVVYWLAL